MTRMNTIPYLLTFIIYLIYHICVSSKDLQPATAVANSLVLSKLEYCNTLYSGISQANNNKKFNAIKTH